MNEVSSAGHREGARHSPSLPTIGRRVRLRPVTNSDYEPLAKLEMGQYLGATWRHFGLTPSPEAFVEGLWTGVAVQFLVCMHDGLRDSLYEGPPVGLVVLYNLDLRHGHGHLAVTKFEQNDWSLRIIDGTVLFIDYVLRLFQIRKIYMETTEFNAPQFQSGGSALFAEEARLKDYFYMDDRYWDKVVLTLERATWNSRRDRYLERVRAH